jgi:hypothetical protein
VPDLDIAAVVRTLNAHGVRYVVIGGVAAMVHNLPLPATVDIDVTPSRDPKNLKRLAEAFDALEASLPRAVLSPGAAEASGRAPPARARRA